MVNCITGSLKGIFAIFMLLYSSFGNAQSRIPVDVRAVYNSQSIPEIMNTVPVGFTFKYAGHHEESTNGFLRGRIMWSNLEISSPQGTIQNGQFTFDRKEVWDNNHQATFVIKIDGKTISCNLLLPYVEHIRFNLYTDSLKRGEPFYLNVEGKFSNGRIYPLDTGMIAFGKSSGGEVLNGQSLLVHHQDTATHSVMVYTWLRASPAMRDSVLIPVKILPDPATLPAEQQIIRER